jgi:lipoprotein-anchoring transpeptidase ErfK/SrfK
MPGGSWGPRRSRRLWRAAVGLTVAVTAVVPNLPAVPAAASTVPAAVSALQLPPHSGSGRRVVYSRAEQRVWAVDGNGHVIKTHPVSGRLHEPRAGTYRVFSRSISTYAKTNPSIRWRYMVRFAHGPNGGNIGFHEIPTRRGSPLQGESQLGQPLSGGCVRQSHAAAVWMWNFAGVGTKVVVL